MPLIILVAALVVVAGLPHEDAHPILLVVHVVALIHVAVLGVETLTPLALAMLEAVLELTYVDAPILPLVLALSPWFSLLVLPCEHVTVGKDI